MAQLQVCESLSRPIKISDMSEIHPTIQWAVRSRQSVLATPERNIGNVANATEIWPDTKMSHTVQKWGKTIQCMPRFSG